VARAIRSFILGLAWSSVWPLYFLIAAQAARLGPWPRDLGLIASKILQYVALGVFLPSLCSWMLRNGGLAERFLDVPHAVCRQICRASRFVSATAMIFLIPIYLIEGGDISPDGRPLTAPTLCRLLLLAFQVSVWTLLFSMLRKGSPLMAWCTLESTEPEIGDAVSTTPAAGAYDGASGGIAASCAEFMRGRRRLVSTLLLGLASGVIFLDVWGYRFSSQRLAVSMVETVLLGAFCWAVHRGLNRLVVKNLWRWRPGYAWALSFSSAVTARNRGLQSGSAEPQGLDSPSPAVVSQDLMRWLSRLIFFGVVAFGAFGFTWAWGLDTALLRFLAGRPLWWVAEQPVTVGDFAKAAAIVLLGAISWRHMSTFFALTLSPRISDDPGVRYAVVTLCRYAVLVLTAIASLGAIRVGTSQISMVVAAMGVGLGFGLQEIVANFVCGIILLLERPIRIGDVVTVGGTTGKVDRINIRATMIINGDNQSMIVPNRQFITGNLVNWTLKDKVQRVTIRVGAAYGSDPEKVVDLLLAICREDPDVLRNPLPSAFFEEFGDFGLKFVLYLYVPDPSLSGRVKHRVSSEIQKRFAEERIEIPYPIQEVRVMGDHDAAERIIDRPQPNPGKAQTRTEKNRPTPPPPHIVDPILPVPRRSQTVVNDSIYRPVDE
jgi:potassium efflux system protein